MLCILAWKSSPTFLFCFILLCFPQRITNVSQYFYGNLEKSIAIKVRLEGSMVSKCYNSNHCLQKKSWSIMRSFHLAFLFSSSIFLNKFQGKLLRGAKKTKRNEERSCPYWKFTNVSSRRWGGSEVRTERSFSKKEDSSWVSPRQKRKEKTQGRI